MTRIEKEALQREDGQRKEDEEFLQYVRDESDEEIAVRAQRQKEMENTMCRMTQSRRPALRRLHAIDARRLRERRSWVVSFRFEAVRPSSEYDAPRGCSRSGTWRTALSNRRLKAEADEKDRWGAASFFLCGAAMAAGGARPLDSDAVYAVTSSARASFERRAAMASRGRRGGTRTGVAAPLDAVCLPPARGHVASRAADAEATRQARPRSRLGRRTAAKAHNAELLRLSRSTTRRRP